MVSRRSAKSLLQWLQLFLLAGFSVGLMAVDHDSTHLAPVRSTLTIMLTPIQWVAAFPGDVTQVVVANVRGTVALRNANTRMLRDRLMLRARLQRYQALKAENNELRALLAAAPRVSIRAIVASVMNVGSAPFARKLVLNRGSRAGVFLGQPVIDANGIMGQVSEVAPFSSQVILITDPDHAIPVQDVRSAQRALVVGTGAVNQVRVPYLTASADIRAGDLLVSSGLGGIFPAGYPVAKVLSVRSDPNEAFLKIIARPAAKLERGRKVLLIWPRKTDPGRLGQIHDR